MAEYMPQENIHRNMAYRMRAIAMGNSFAEAVSGIGAITLAIIGLAHVASGALLSIATIIVGLALLFEGGAIAERYSALSYESGLVLNKFKRRLGTAGLFIAATGAIALGILSLLSFVPMILVPIAVMALGTALIIVGAINERLNAMEIAETKAERVTQEMTRETAMRSSGLVGFVGIAAVALGVLSLAGISPMILSFAAILSIGTAQLLNGSMMTRMLNLLRREHTAEYTEQHVSLS